MRSKIILGGVVAIAVLMVVAGCGSSDSSSSGGSTSEAGASTSSGEETTGSAGTTTSASEGGDGSSSGPLTTAEFKTEGNKICTGVPANFGKQQQELEKELKEQGKKKPSPAELNLKAAVPPLYTAVEEFEELTPPKGEEQKAEEIISALEAAAKGLEEKPTSELSGPSSPFAEFQKVTKEYGMETCSQL